MTAPENRGLHCPLPDGGDSEVVTLAHGEGGRIMRDLIARRIFLALGDAAPHALADAAILPAMASQPVFTTDSFVVSPVEFPGGDIGSLAVIGTANDLAVSGARPRWLSMSLILEEGFSLARLDRLLSSAAAAARSMDMKVITGDTKVVPRGAADGLFINTAGIGEMLRTLAGPTGLEPGDQLLVTGPVGCHGVAILSAREQLAFDPSPVSDCAPLWPAVEALLHADVPVKAMRDATRGGVAAVLHEWAENCGNTLLLEASQLPLTSAVSAVCELLGLDPLHLANEGTMLIAVPAGAADLALSALHAGHPEAALIGKVIAPQNAPAVIRRALGQLIPINEPAGAPLPRIC